MAIRFTDDYNQLIRREVRNFNKRRRAAIKSRQKNIPDKVYVSQLKKRYDTRADLNRELEILGEYRRSAQKEVETAGGVKAIKWDLEHIKANMAKAKEYFAKEEAILAERAPKYPGERQRLDTIRKNRAILEYDMNTMSQEQYESLKGSINSYIRARNIMGSGYRGFLSEVDDVMNSVGVPQKQKEQFFKKINSLSQEEFFYMYERSDLIKRIYDLYVDKDEEGNINLNTTKNDAKGLVDLLLGEVDVLVDEAKNRK